MVNPLLAKLTALLFGLFPQLEGVRFLGQETGNFGGFDADVTAFERDGIPGVLLRVQNSSDKIAWWDKRGEWTSSSSWSVYREGNSSDGFSVHLGCSPPYSWGESPSPEADIPRWEDDAPTRFELEQWSVHPGEYRFWQSVYVRETFFDEPGDPEITTVSSWRIHFDVALPIWGRPSQRKEVQPAMTFKVRVDSLMRNFELDLVGQGY